MTFDLESRDSIRTGTGTVLGWNNVALVRSQNIFYSLDILRII